MSSELSWSQKMPCKKKFQTFYYFDQCDVEVSCNIVISYRIMVSHKLRGTAVTKTHKATLFDISVYITEKN